MFDYKGSHDRSQVEKTIRYSIRKVSFGAASVAVAALFMFLGNGAVSATEQGVTSTNEETQSSPLKDPDVQNGTYGATPVVSQMDGNSGSSDTTAPKGQEETTTPAPTDVSGSSVASSSVSATEAGNKTDRSSTTPSTEEVEEKARPALDTKQLEDYVAEIDGKLASGSYATKTDESVATLKGHLELAKLALTTATSQDELTKAYRRLFMTASSGLRSKPKAQVESPKLDTTEGKATVGKKASNTEKATGTNSIANSGQHDPRNRQALDRNNPFRTDESTTDTDPAANQTYTAPAENADLKTLATTLQSLPDTIQNNKKIQSMDELGKAKNVAKGSVTEIDEFGGWRAVSSDGQQGKFAIARKTDRGVFPVETLNTTNNQYDTNRKVWLREQSFDRTSEYMLFLTKVRSYKNHTEAAYDDSTYVRVGEGGASTAKAVKGFQGIEKTFRAYSSNDGSRIKVAFKTGYSGDINNTKAGYKVEVYSIGQDGTESSIYTTTFYPQKGGQDKDKTVVAAKDGTTRNEVLNANGLTENQVNEKLAEENNKPNGTGGSFTSRDIELPKGAVSYKVRISNATDKEVGLSYQSPYLGYALPVTGLDFSIEQDTSSVAKNLLQKVYDKLLETRDSDKRGKTPETQQAYQNQLDAINQLLAGELKSTAEYKKILNVTLQKQAELKVDKSTLTSSKASLDDLVNDDPTPGKTPETVAAYNQAKTAAEQEAEKAKAVIDSDTATVDEVAQAVANVKAARAELTAARALLVVAATDAQKTKLQNDSEALKEADKTGKTPKSIKEYEDKYKTLEAALTAAKEKAKTVLDKTVNAGKVEATDAQIEVDKIKAELDKAATLLKDKGNTSELEEAKNDLSDYITQQTNDNVTAGKTKDSQDAYAIAKTAADKAVEDAAAVIASENSTVEDVANALADIKVKRAALEAAKKNLVPAATEAQKAKLEKTVAKLVETSTEGKTPDSIHAYNTRIQEITEELNQAKAAAEKIKTDGANATKLAALEAQVAVDEALAKLEETKALLVEAATAEQKATLAEDASKLVEASKDGKTPSSIAAYEAKIQDLTAELEAAKAAAEAVKTAGENASKADAIAAQAKVNDMKAKLAEAATLLKDKANTTALETAKDELKAEAAKENVTAGKTPATAEKYDAAKAAADQAVKEAETVIGNPDATSEEVATALANVNAKKAALSDAKAALVEAATAEQKATLAEDASKLVEASKDGKTPSSIAAYEAKIQDLTAELEAAKAAAEAVKTAGENASKADAIAAQAKVNDMKAKLAEAATLLKDKANTTALETAKDELKAEAAKENVTAGKTPATAEKYDAAKVAADQAVKEAETVIGNPDATSDEVATALANVNAKKAALSDAKAALVEAATAEQKATLAEDASKL
ncbi:YSIRK-type signal peptide-containing protein, partial [Streptococcus sp.]